MSICESMKRPRLHCNPNGVVSMEIEGFDPEIGEFLIRKGYKIDRHDRYSFYHGAIHGILHRQSGSGFQGVAEMRRDGIASGY